MIEATEPTTVRGFTVRVVYGEDAQSPRRDRDNAWVWWSEARYSELGEIIPRHRDDCWTDGDWIDSVRSPGDSVVLLRRTERGIERVSETSRADVLAVLSAETLADEWQGDREAAYRCLDAEITDYNGWMQGERYGFIVTGPDGGEVDSCWGFDALDYCEAEGHDAAEYAADALLHDTLATMGSAIGAVVA